MSDRVEQLGDDIAAFVRDAQADELDAALLVGRAVAEEFDSGRCRTHVDALAERCPKATEPWSYLAGLGFAGNRGDHDAIACSRLDRVLDSRRGLPISLGVLLIHVAKRAGREAVGINFPGHFLVRVDSHLVDPFVMATISEADCISQFSQDGRVPAHAVFEEAPPAAILLRMLNNVKYQYASVAQWDRALDMVDWQLRAQPLSAQLFFERGELWSRLGSVTAARDAFAQVLRLSDDQQLHAAAQSRLASLGGNEPIH
jgi:regulator of sirC expression with transglutaminase-like and TPR domain